jgi:hypothetical protein
VPAVLAATCARWLPVVQAIAKENGGGSTNSARRHARSPPYGQTAAQTIHQMDCLGWREDSVSDRR